MGNKTVILFFIQNNLTITSFHCLKEGDIFAKEPSQEGTVLKEGIDLFALKLIGSECLILK